MRPFDRVVLIFNPASTGDASALAAELRDELQRRQPDLPVTLQPTEHAGHARDLARDAARTGRPLLVSVSGDGGYNEVVDGTMQAGNDAAVCAVLPAGTPTTTGAPPANSRWPTPLSPVPSPESTCCGSPLADPHPRPGMPTLMSGWV